ncbi:putative transcription factor B3-Domain family [Helianthus anomalus]
MCNFRIIISCDIGIAIPNDFATTNWGDKIPYYKTVEIRDGDNLRMVRIRKTNDGPIFTDGWIVLDRDYQLKYKDGVLIKAVGQFKFEVSCFKELVCQNSYLTTQVENELGMSSGGFKAGWRKVVEEVTLDSDYFLSTADADVIVESKLSADVSEDDLEGNPKDVKGKSKLDDGLTQRTLRSRVEKVNAAPIIGSPVLKFTKLAEDRIASFLDIFYCLVSSAISITYQELKVALGQYGFCTKWVWVKMVGYRGAKIRFWVQTGLG